MDCKQMVRLISDALDTELTHAERARVRLHLFMCDNCRDVNDQMGFLRRTMQQIGREELAPGLRKHQSGS